MESALDLVPRGLGYTLLTRGCLGFEKEGTSLAKCSDLEWFMVCVGLRVKSEEDETVTGLAWGGQYKTSLSSHDPEPTVRQENKRSRQTSNYQPYHRQDFWRTGTQVWLPAPEPQKQRLIRTQAVSPKTIRGGKACLVCCFPICGQTSKLAPTSPSLRNTCSSCLFYQHLAITIPRWLLTSTTNPSALVLTAPNGTRAGNEGRSLPLPHFSPSFCVPIFHLNAHKSCLARL